MKKPAFTMLELVMVIVVLGILAALAIPRLDRDLKQEAADSILSDIRYTQHLALTDNKHRFNQANWQRAFWRITFESCANDSGLFMGIGSDMDRRGDTNRVEAAIDPVNGKPMFWKNTDSCANGGDGTVSERIFLSKKFTVTSISGAGGCNGVQHIGFDNSGRPHVSFSNSDQPNYASIITRRCTFNFTLSDGDDFAIHIEPETGYAFIDGQPSS